MIGACEFGSTVAEPKGADRACGSSVIVSVKRWVKRQLAPAAREEMKFLRVRCAGAPYADFSPQAEIYVVRQTATAAPSQTVRSAVAHSDPRPARHPHMVAFGSLFSDLFLHPLTPTHFDAINMVRQMSAAKRAGGAVAGATARNQNCNRYSIEIFIVFSVVARLRPLARVYHVTRVRACASARTRMCVGLETPQPVQPVQPNEIMYVYLEFSGCAFGCTKMAGATTAVAKCFEGAAIASNSSETNILEGFYSPCAVDALSIEILIRSSSFNPAPEAKNFEPAAARRAGVARAGRRSRGLGKNGGFLRFFGMQREHVGKAALEWSMQCLVNADLSHSGHKPFGLASGLTATTRRPPLADLDRQGGMPPFAERLLPSPIAPEAFAISFALLNVGHRAVALKLDSGKSGSGVKRPVQSHGEAWRGRGNRLSLGEVRRGVHASVGGADVKQA